MTPVVVGKIKNQKPHDDSPCFTSINVRTTISVMARNAFFCRAANNVLRKIIAKISSGRHARFFFFARNDKTCLRLCRTHFKDPYVLCFVAKLVDAEISQRSDFRLNRKKLDLNCITIFIIYTLSLCDHYDFGIFRVRNFRRSSRTVLILKLEKLIPMLTYVCERVYCLSYLFNYLYFTQQLFKRLTCIWSITCDNFYYVSKIYQ